MREVREERIFFLNIDKRGVENFIWNIYFWFFNVILGKFK